MGKMTIILTMGMSVIIAFFVLRLNVNTREGLSTTVNMYENTQARLVANSGVEVYLEKMRRDKSLNSGTFLNNKMFDATYDVYIIPGTNDSVTIKSIAYYMNATHETVVKALRYPVAIPNAPASIYVSTAAVQNAKLNGNFLVSGYNYDKDGKNPIKTGASIVPGIVVDNPADSVEIKNNLGKNTSNQITGKGGTPSIAVNNYNIDWAGVSNDLAFSADQTLGTGTYNGGTFGTYSSPQITLINGDATFNGNATGSGILIVNGDLTIRGTFEFKGIIIAYKEATIKTELNGTGSVIGSLIISGNSVDMSISNGTFNALYSKATLDNAKLNLKSSRFKILSWWE